MGETTGAAGNSAVDSPRVFRPRRLAGRRPCGGVRRLPPQRRRAVPTIRRSSARSASTPGRWRPPLPAPTALPETLSGRDARAFFEASFRPLEVVPPEGQGFFTGYYEPEVAGSLTRTAEFTVPLLARPDDLVEFDPANPPPGLDPALRFARKTEDGYQRICRPRGDHGRRTRRTRAGAGVARRPGRCLLHPYPGGGAHPPRRRAHHARDLCRQDRPSLHAHRPGAGRTRRASARQRHHAGDPRLAGGAQPARPRR